MRYDTQNHIHKIIREKIVSSIEQGVYQPGSRLPSESDLAREFDVSRNSIREALASLEQDGVVIRRQGIGTIVASHPIHMGNRIDTFQPIPQIIENLGYEAGLAFNNVEWTKGPSFGHENLQIPGKTSIRVSKRLYTANGRPAIYLEEYFDPRLVQEPENWSDLTGNMMEFLYGPQGIEIHHVYARFKAKHAPPEVYRIFQVDSHFPFLYINHFAYNMEGQIISCTETFDNSEILQYEFVRVREH